MPAPGAGGVQTSLVGTVQSMMASARNAFRRKPGPTPGAPIQSPGGNPPDLTQFSETFEPSGGLFAPGYPLPPVEPERLRALDYPVGYNYIYTPRSFEPIGFAELRALAQNHDITRLCIETRKDQIEALDWSIKPRDERNPKAGADKRVDALTEFGRLHRRHDRFRRPEILKVDSVSLREIFIIEPVRALLWTEIAHDETPAVAKNLKHGTQHTRLVADVMERELATDEIKTLGLKGQHRGIRLDPGYIPQFRLRLTQHAE